MKRGEVHRDFTSAFVSAFRPVSGTKTWPVNQTRRGSAGKRAKATITTKLAVRTQTPTCCADMGEVQSVASGPLWSTDSTGDTTEPLCSQDPAL